MASLNTESRNTAFKAALASKFIGYLLKMNKKQVLFFWLITKKNPILANKQRHCLDHRYILYYD